MNRILIFLVILFALILIGVFVRQKQQPPKIVAEVNQELQLNMETPEQPTLSPPVAPDPLNSNGSHVVTLNTNKGTIKFETYDNDAPLAVENFKNLAGAGFYDNLIFHRVISGFMIQGGDPEGDGTGGPGYGFVDELNTNTLSVRTGYRKGVVAMANSGPDTNGSQFFIMLENYPLPPNYTIFGKVVEGQEVVDEIGRMETSAGDRPMESVIMESVSVEEK